MVECESQLFVKIREVGGILGRGVLCLILLVFVLQEGAREWQRRATTLETIWEVVFELGSCSSQHSPQLDSQWPENILGAQQPFEGCPRDLGRGRKASFPWGTATLE